VMRYQLRYVRLSFRRLAAFPGDGKEL
jgi:hypothetical protein